jgi:hypothetical protein
MNIISDENKIQFYKYLNGDISVLDLEDFIYKQSDLAQQLDDETYSELISFNYKEKNGNRLQDFLFGQIIDEGQFETWKLKNILNAFLADYERLDTYLIKFYRLYCGIYQGDGQRKFAFKFLGHLGLNNLWWLDEGYLTMTFGENWKIEYDKSIADFEFYHKQFQPIANRILTALKNNRIQIFSNGTYVITDELKNELESNEIFELKHPDRG